MSTVAPSAIGENSRASLFSMTRFPFKFVFLSLLGLAFVTLIWVNRTGKLEPKAYQDHGEFLPADEQTPQGAMTVNLGTFVQKIYNFEVQSQTFSAEGWVWLIWSAEFQALLDTQKIPVSELLSLLNLVEASSSFATPVSEAPRVLPDGRICQVFRYTGKFYASHLNFRRFPFETLHFPLTFSLNLDLSALDARHVRLVPDQEQSGLGQYTNLPGYVTTGRQMTEWIYQFPSHFGIPAGPDSGKNRFSTVQMEVIYRTSTVSAVLQLFLPLAVIMAIVLLAPNLAGSLWDVRVALPSTALLTLIFLQQGYRAQLPSLPYLTFIDQVYTLCYAVALIVFSLFVWSSNRLEQATPENRDQVIHQINRTDLRFQIVLTVALITLVCLSWIFPGR